MHADIALWIEALQNPKKFNIAWGMYALPDEDHATLFIHRLDANRNEGSLHFLMQPFFLEGSSPAINVPVGETFTLPSPFPNELNNLICEGWESSEPPVDMLQEDYLSYVSESIAALTQERKKVMCARSARQDALELKPFRMWEDARKAYPKTFTWFFTSPYTGSWLGASPELLLAADALNLHSVSLAGTRKEAGTAAWDNKEKVEQALVTEWIVNCFQNFGLMEVRASEPETMRFGPLEHLKSEVHGRAFLPDPEGLRNLAIRLHPTPAVGSVPKDWGIKHIAENEGENRTYYTGYVGIWDSQQNFCRLFVNLRCMQWFKEQPVLYAGAGITAASDPEREWEETEEKMATLKRVLW